MCYISDHTSSSSSSSSIIYDERLLRSLMKIISTVSSVDEGRGCSSSRGASSSSPSALPSTGIKWWSLSFVIDIVRHHWWWQQQLLIIPAILLGSASSCYLSACFSSVSESWQKRICLTFINNNNNGADCDLIINPSWNSSDRELWWSIYLSIPRRLVSCLASPSSNWQIEISQCTRRRTWPERATNQ